LQARVIIKKLSAVNCKKNLFERLCRILRPKELIGKFSTAMFTGKYQKLWVGRKNSKAPKINTGLFI